jgi:hypothetical protein
MPPDHSHPSFSKVNIAPGVNTQATPTQNSGRWSSSNLVRFKDGFLQKLGGWQQLTASSLTGKSRGLHAFEDLSGNSYLLSGSSTAAQVYFNGSIYTLSVYSITVQLESPWLNTTIVPHEYVAVTTSTNGIQAGNTIRFDTPLQWIDGSSHTIYPSNATTVIDVGSNLIDLNVTGSVTVTPNILGGYPPAYSTLQGSPTVTVTLVSHGLSPGSTYIVYNTVSVGGTTLFGPYTVTSVDDADDFEITPAIAPQFTQNGVWELTDTSGNPVGQFSVLGTIPNTVTNWSLDNFGQVGLLCWQNGPLLAWQPDITNLVAISIANSPSAMTGMFVGMPQAQIIAYGCAVASVQDPLLIQFSDAGNYTVWTADATNQAGSFRLSRGSKIVGGLQAPTISLIWTDIDLWSMQYVGPPFVYSFNIVQSGCGLISQRAACVLYGTTYWMSQKQFFEFGSSGVNVLPCDVWDEVFNDIDPNNVDLIFAGSNAAYNEILFYYASESGGTGEIDSYVKMNVVSKVWDYGKLTRTAWIDQSVFGPPIGSDGSALLQQHEVGYDANGLPMTGAYAESGFVDLGDGTDIIYVDQLIPDFKWFGTGGYVIVTLYAQSYPGAPVQTYGPYTVNETSKFFSLRTRARQVAFRVEWGNATGFSARMGANRLRTGSAGRVA